MTQTFEPLWLAAMGEAHMPQVMALQALCYSAIAPETLAAMAAKRRASHGLAHVAALTAEKADALAEGDLVPQALSAYIIAMPIRWPNLPALNSAPEPELQADTLYVHDLAICPSARGQGVGERLLQAVQHRADAMGLKQAALVAIQGSVPFWQRQGFVCVAAPAALVDKLNSYGEAQLMVRHMAWPA